MNQKRMTMAKFELFRLPYDPESLRPVISGETLSFHHAKHLQTYVNNLNAAIEGTPFADMTLEEIVVKSEAGMRNNAGQVLNHNLYFGQFRQPTSDNRPTGALLAAIEKSFGTFDNFQQTFAQQGTTLFGSGWVWLSQNAQGELLITQENNAANPIQKGLRPLLTFDVWEHAYYLDYQNRRADHLAALWQIIDWDVVAGRMV